MKEQLFSLKKVSVVGEVQVLTSGRKFLLVNQLPVPVLSRMAAFRVIEPIPLPEKDEWLPPTVTLNVPVGGYLMVMYDLPTTVTTARATGQWVDTQLVEKYVEQDEFERMISGPALHHRVGVEE